MKDGVKEDALVQKMMKFHREHKKQRHKMVEFFNKNEISKNVVLSFVITILKEYEHHFKSKNLPFDDWVNWKAVDLEKTLGGIASLHVLLVFIEMLSTGAIMVEDLKAADINMSGDILTMIGRTGRLVFDEKDK